MYTLLTGAKKNLGDFLIVHKCKELLTNHTGSNDFLELKRWEPLEPNLEKINKTKAVIICGGPGYASHFYPNIFPLTKKLTDIKVPIIPFGLGWCGQPMNYPERFRFTGKSLKALRFIHDSCSMSSCRDVITKNILNRYGFKNVIMTGCPVWYDLQSLGKGFTPPSLVCKVALSFAQNPIYYQLNIKLLKGIANLYSQCKQKVELIAVFHRGIQQDKHTNQQDASYLQKLIKFCENYGYRVLDASYDVSKGDIYKECDVHIGFRVHAHLYCLSMRKPSFLLWEDGRGKGASESLGTRDFSAVQKWYPFHLHKLITELLFQFRVHNPLVINSKSIDNIINYLNEQQNNSFSAFKDIGKIIDNHFKIMQSFLSTLPS